MNTEKKVVTFLHAQSDSKALERFHVRITTGLGGVDAFLYDKTREDVLVVLATVSIDLSMSQQAPLVRVSYPAHNGRPTELRHTFLAAAGAACDLAESLEAHLRG